MNTKKHQKNQLNLASRLALGGSLVLLAFTVLFFFATTATAAGLSVTPITWNVMGLDSNNVNVGPNNFPVGVRVCNTSGGTASNVTATFSWVTTDTYINLRTGSQNPIVYASLANGACHDFYFEVTITRNSNAYNHTARYQIDVSANPGLTGVSPTPREIYVEHLISQNRNSTNDIKLNGTVIAPGGSMSLLVGNTYIITLDGSTATQGYEQLESFINFPNTIFRVDNVTSSYSANAGTDPLGGTTLYANGCNWMSDPRSANYRSCLSTGKYGGTVAVTYTITIIGGAGTSSVLSSLLYDFSGSSYHYNSDFSTSAVIANIIGPSDLKIAKSFVPNSILADGVTTSTLKLTIANTMTIAMSGVNFTDTLPTSPANLVVANPPNASYTGCGSPTFAPSAGNNSISFSNGTIAANSNCIIKVDVKASSAVTGTFNNTTGHLYLNGTTPGTGTDTTNTASGSLVAANATPCVPNQTMAWWTVPSTAVLTPDNGSGAPTTKASNVATATLAVRYTSGAGGSSIDSTTGVNDGYSLKTNGYKNAGQIITLTVDTRHYQNVSLSLPEQAKSVGPSTVVVSTSTGSGFSTLDSFAPTTSWVTKTYSSLTTSLTGVTIFIITGFGANNDNTGADLSVDNIQFTGCGNSFPPPTLTKTFTPTTTKLGATTILTFTLSNTQAGNENLTSVKITDTLPTGLQVASTPGGNTTCTGPAFSPSAGATSISYTATSMNAGTTCKIWLNVTATQAGSFDNVTDFISASESGANKTSTGYGGATLSAIAPPSISKSFAASAITTTNTTTLNFTIANPNQSITLTGVTFTDTLPSGISVATSSTSQCGGTLATTNPSWITLTLGSINPSSSCTFGVTVTGVTSTTVNNVTGNVSSTEGGTGNTAAATLAVRTATPKISFLKQIGPTSTGPWSAFLARTTGDPVYYQFTVENIGDQQLTNVVVNDQSALSPFSCTLSTTTINLYSSTTCVVGPYTAVAGSVPVTNTANATSTQVNSTNSSASYAGKDPIATAVTLSQFIVRSDGPPWIALGIGALVITVGLALALSRKRK